MLTMENVTALRMRRHCLTRRAGAAEYDALYRDLSPGLNVHWHGFGQPPCLVERADFDDVPAPAAAHSGERAVPEREHRVCGGGTDGAVCRPVPQAL
mgnify:CR=1 FL=1